LIKANFKIIEIVPWCESKKERGYGASSFQGTKLLSSPFVCQEK